MVLNLEGTRLRNTATIPKHTPKDHIAENVRRMRHIQKEQRKKTGQGNAPVKGLWKSQKYEGVESRVKENLQKEANKSRPQSASTYLRAHSRTGFDGATPTAPRPSSATRPSSAQRPMSAGRPASAERDTESPVPRADIAKDVQLKRNNFDFIKINGVAARHSAVRRSPSLTALDDLKKKQEEGAKNYKKGEVPKYLAQRQKQWQQEEEERIAAIPDPDMPQGHRVMPTSERVAMLDKLKQSQQTLMQQLASMPVRTDTLRIRTRKESIEQKLAEVEEAIAIFSRTKVFVKEDC